MAQAPQRQSMRERMREQAEKAASGGASYIKVPDGKKVTWFQPKVKDDGQALDFLPYEVTVKNHPKGMRPGDLWSQRSFKVHYGVGAQEAAVVCPKSMGIAKCPVCEERADMANDPNLTAAEKKLMDDLKPKDRTLYQLIDLDEEAKGVQLWDYSYHLFEKRLLSDINKTEHAAPGRQRSTPHGGFAELVGGQTLTLSFTEKKNPGFNAFKDCDRIDAINRADYGEEILDEVFDLDTIIEVLSYEALKAMLHALDEEPAAEAPAGRKGRGSAPVEEPAEEPAPTGRRRGAATSAEEPEPAPSRGRRAAPAEEPAAEPAPTRGRRGAAPVEEEPPAPTRGRRGAAGSAEEPAPSRPKRGTAPANDDPECVAGGTFGKDSQIHDACYDCPDATWEACAARNLELKAGK